MTSPGETSLETEIQAGEQPEGSFSLFGQAKIRELSQRLADQARRELLILSLDLDPEYYDQVPFVEAVRRLSLGSPHQPVRVLLRDPRAVTLKGHRLVALARQLTSRIAIRRLGDDFKDRQDAFLIADGRGYCVRRLAEVGEGLADLNGPRRARLLRAEFEQMWERSDADSELRRLYL